MSAESFAHVIPNTVLNRDIKKTPRLLQNPPVANSNRAVVVLVESANEMPRTYLEVFAFPTSGLTIAGKNRLPVSHDRKMLRPRVEFDARLLLAKLA